MTPSIGPTNEPASAIDATVETGTPIAPASATVGPVTWLIVPTAVLRPASAAVFVATALLKPPMTAVLEATLPVVKLMPVLRIFELVTTAKPNHNLF